MFLNRLLLFVMALCLGSLLVRMHLPIPFLLGGLLTALLCKTLTHRSDVSWPKQWREYALMVAGYGIGSTFTSDTWNNFLAELVGVAEATIVILAASIALAFVTAKLARENLKSCIMGMLPGGMTLTMLLCEDDKEVNPNVVMVMQVLRLLGVVITVPFLVIWLLNAHVTGSSVALPNHGGVHWLVVVPLSILGSFIATKIHMPTPKLLGPILATAAFSVFDGGVQPVPFWLMAAAQASIGLFMGMQLDADRIVKTEKMVPYILIGTAILIVVSIGMANVLSARYGFSLVTAFLAMAPGGIAEMSLAGMSMGGHIRLRDKDICNRRERCGTQCRKLGYRHRYGQILCFRFRFDQCGKIGLNECLQGSRRSKRRQFQRRTLGNLRHSRRRRAARSSALAVLSVHSVGLRRHNRTRQSRSEHDIVACHCRRCQEHSPRR